MKSGVMFPQRGVQGPPYCHKTQSVSLHVPLSSIHTFIQEGKLYYVGPKKDEKREVVIEAERKRQIFLDCHFNDIGHHLGQKKTVHRIQSKYYWLGIIKDVVDWVRTSFVSSVFCSHHRGVMMMKSNLLRRLFAVSDKSMRDLSAHREE